MNATHPAPETTEGLLNGRSRFMWIIGRSDAPTTTIPAEYVGLGLSALRIAKCNAERYLADWRCPRESVFISITCQRTGRSARFGL